MKNTIRNYNNKVLIRFKERGESFTLNVPHRNKWLAIIRFLKRRGFSIGENEYYKKEYRCLSKYHKIGRKKNVVCLMEITCFSINVEFGNIKNLWADMPQSFWDSPNDERYTKLTYLERLSIKLEIKKLMQFCEKYNHELIREDSFLNPKEFIINKLKKNPHIHGNVNCLEDIGRSIRENSYDYRHNSTDKNGKQVICGDTKAFYDRNRRLSIGKAWHNINNMWWVIVNNELRNIACVNLFDFDKSLPIRKPMNEGELKRLLKKLESNKEYLKCHHIQNKYSHVSI